MMNKNNLILILSLFCFLFFSSCKKDAPLNSEAEVIAFSFNPSTILASRATISNDKILIQIRPEADISSLEPVFLLSKGATLAPEVKGKKMNFSIPVEFVVKSEDQTVEKKYTVIVSYGAAAEVPNDTKAVLYSFEN